MRFIYLLLIFLVGCSEMEGQIVPFPKGPAAPLYSTLSNIELILDATGARPNTTNDYAIVSGSNVETWKSIAPGPTGRDFVTAAIITSGNALKLIDGVVTFAGGARVTHATASTWNFLHYNATFANLDWTIHMVMQINKPALSNPGVFYSILGNNAAATANKGVTLGFNDESPSNAAGYFLTTRANANYVDLSNTDNVFPIGVPFVLTIEADHGLAAADRIKFFVDGVQKTSVNASLSTAVVTTPTSTLSIGAITGHPNGFNGWISHVVIQSGVESSGTRDAFIQSLIPYTQKKGDVWYYQDEARRFRTIQLVDETTKYYLTTGLDQNPTALNTVVKYYRHDDAHVSTAAGKIRKQKSTDRGYTYGTVADVYDPASNDAVADMGGGYLDDGTHMIICDVHDATAMDTWTVKMLTSTDDYDTSPTVTDITSAIAVDGYTGIRCYGNLIENNGVIMKPYYKTSTEASSANSAVYILRSTDGGANWSSVTVDSNGASPYVNEGTIIGLDNNNVILVARNETTDDWSFYYSTDNGQNWTDDGDFGPFGLTLTNRQPGILTKFNITNASTKEVTEVVGFWFPDRDGSDTFHAVFGKVSDIISTHKTGFVTGTLRTMMSSTDTGGRILHYGDVLHPYGDFTAFGAYAREPATITNTENTHLTFTFPTDWFSALCTALSITL